MAETKDTKPPAEPSRVPILLAHARPGFDGDGFARVMADFVVKAVQDARKRAGLPPLLP